MKTTHNSQHWSASKEWQAYLAAKEAVQRTYASASPFRIDPLRIEVNSPEVTAALEAFHAKYPPEGPATDENPELVQAEQNLRAAVTKMMRWAKVENIVQIVRSCGPAREEQIAFGGWRPSSR
jgi:hypothetical protein